MYRKNAWENLAEDEKEQLSAFAEEEYRHTGGKNYGTQKCLEKLQ